MHPDVEEASRLLADVAHLRARTRDVLSANGCQWMAVWSVVAFGAAFTVLVEALHPVAGFYWPVAVPVAILVTGHLERRAKLERPVRRDDRVFWLIGALMVVVNFGGSLFLAPATTVVLIWVVMGLGFAAFAHLEGHHGIAARLWLATLATPVIAVAMADNFDAYALISLLFGGVLAAAALEVRTRLRPS